MKKLFLAVAVSAVFLWLNGVASAFSVSYSPGIDNITLTAGSIDSVTVSFDITSQHEYGVTYSGPITNPTGNLTGTPVNFNPSVDKVVGPKLTMQWSSSDASSVVKTISLTDAPVFDFALYGITISFLNGSGIADLNADGIVAFEIKADSGQFSIDTLSMTGEIQPKTPDVPIPTAAWLFGTGMIALMGVRRIKFS